MKNTVCYIDLSEGREHKPKSVRISPLWVTKHILFTSFDKILPEKVFYLHYLLHDFIIWEKTLSWDKEIFSFLL